MNKIQTKSQGLLLAVLVAVGFLISPLPFIQGTFWTPLPAEAASQSQVDVNKASGDELMQLKGIGPKTAENIIQYREEHGPFKSVEDLINVKGIGGKKLEGIRENIKI